MTDQCFVRFVLDTVLGSLEEPERELLNSDLETRGMLSIDFLARSAGISVEEAGPALERGRRHVEAQFRERGVPLGWNDLVLLAGYGPSEPSAAPTKPPSGFLDEGASGTGGGWLASPGADGPVTPDPHQDFLSTAPPGERQNCFQMNFTDEVDDFHPRRSDPDA